MWYVVELALASDLILSPINISKSWTTPTAQEDFKIEHGFNGIF
jgi:hypothetical protein